MPELAEVEYHRRRWDPGRRQKVRAVLVHADKRVFRGTDALAAARKLRGQTLLESWTHGKQMLFRFSGGHWLGVHLGMTGELRQEGKNYHPQKHDHLVLRQAQRTLVFADSRQFGRIRFDEGPMAPAWWRALPPAVTTRGFTLERVQQCLQRRTRSPIKAVLLLQQYFPGIGNWMADEILWRAGIHPALRCGQVLAASKRLWEETRQVAAGALRIVARDYSDPPTSWLFPHRWKKAGRCPRDDTPLHRAGIGGRTTAWCPRCQPAKPRNPRPTPLAKDSPPEAGVKRRKRAPSRPGVEGRRKEPAGSRQSN
jgi:formamidopyrimidine-DNA glycosylase